MIRLLVICTGNSCRSQMAEGFLRHFGGETIEVCSAGIEKRGVNPKAITVMAEIGIDLSGHTSNNLSEYICEKFDYVITVCDNAAERCPVFPRESARFHWPIDDPAEAVGTEEELLTEFRRIRDMIGLKAKEWLASIKTD